jgi:hypothetical protein
MDKHVKVEIKEIVIVTSSGDCIGKFEIDSKMVRPALAKPNIVMGRFMRPSK